MTAMGCSTADVTAAPTPSVRASQASATDVCQPIDLRAPSGERVDLTGTWQILGNGPTFYVLQDGDCVWLIGPFRPADHDQGFLILGEATLVFDGHLRSDFTVRGRSALLRYVTLPGSGGPYTRAAGWTLDIDAPMTLRPFDPETQPTLVKISDSYLEP